MSAVATGDRVEWIDDASRGTVYDVLPSGSFGVRWDDGSKGWFHADDLADENDEREGFVRKVM